MLISGVITCSMLLAVVMPQTIITSMFGENLNEPLALVIVRSWGFLVFLMGGLLIYGALNPVYRRLCLSIVTISKAAFIIILFTFANQYLGSLLSTIILDALLVLVFTSYLLTSQSAD